MVLMPLIKSTTDEARSKNIETLVHDGYSTKQAAAIAYRIQRTEMKKRHLSTLHLERHRRERAAESKGPMKRSKKRLSRARENPSGTTILVIGAGVTLLGVAAYFLMKKPTTAATPQVAASQAPQLQAPSLPAGANIAAATNAVHLMRLGHQAEVTPAASWLSQFQTSVGLPATGRMDPTTRAYLNLATPDAASLSTPTILG
jgi:hypothetical protein